jgi:aminomethyltransferase
MKKSIALARLPKDVPDGEIVRVDVRGRALAARVVKPPFVRKGRILVE